MRIPEPLSAFKFQPEVVFYPLREVGDFCGFLTERSAPERLEAVARVAEGLRTWHRCGLKPWSKEDA